MSVGEEGHIIDITTLNKKGDTFQSCLDSTLINKLLKYVPKELKHKIISQRILERYKDKNEINSEAN